MNFETYETGFDYSNEMFLNEPSVITSYDYTGINEMNLGCSYVIIPTDTYFNEVNNFPEYGEESFDAYINDYDFIGGEIFKNVFVNEGTPIKEELIENNESKFIKEENDKSCNDTSSQNDVSKNENTKIENEVKRLKRKLEEYYKDIDQKNDYIETLKNENNQKEHEIQKRKKRIFWMNKDLDNKVIRID